MCACRKYSLFKDLHFRGMHFCSQNKQTHSIVSFFVQVHKIYQSPLADQLFLVSQVLPFVLFLRVLLLQQKKNNYYIR